MTLEFREKTNSNTKEYENVNKLYDFLINNLIYLRLVMDMMSKNKSKMSGKKLKRAIERNIKCNENIKKSSKYQEFITLMDAFYNVKDNDILNDQRGLLLEKLWYYSGPYYYNGNYYETTKEAQVFLNNNLFYNYENDIDIVYEIASNEFNYENGIENFKKYLQLVELDECKSSAENTSIIPMDDGNKRKFELMQHVKVKLVGEELSCFAHVITYDGSSNQTLYWLERQGFTEIEVICRKNIERRLLNK